MEPPPARKTAPVRLPLSGTQRLVLAISAAGAVVTLCWAALQVRAAKDEARQAQARAEKSSTASPPEQSPNLPDKIAALERRLADEETRRRQAETDAAAQIKQREEVIVFLRKENTAAQETIKRLSTADSASGVPEAAGVETQDSAASDQLAIGRAEALNSAISQFVQANGRTRAARSWSAKTNAERFALIKGYLAYAPPSLAEYQPDGYTYTLPSSTDTRVQITKKNGTPNPEPVIY